MQAIKKIYWWYYDNFLETELLKHYIYSILQQNKFNIINIKFKFRVLEAPLMDENMGTKISIP